MFVFLVKLHAECTTYENFWCTKDKTMLHVAPKVTKSSCCVAELCAPKVFLFGAQSSAIVPLKDVQIVDLQQNEIRNKKK